MHERAAAALGVRCHYQLIEIAGAGREELRAMLDGIRRLGFAGVNVTYPYKEAVVALLDELSPTAHAIGAVNTVVVRDNRLVGYNTDTTGFERAVRGLLAAASPSPVALIGAGGVGKAIAFALASLGVAGISIFDTDRARPSGSRRNCQTVKRAGSRTASRTSCAAPSVWSMRRRSACCLVAICRCRRRCCTRDCGLRMRSIRRYGRRF
jgi:shikimate 5-dehydrogenase